MARRNEIKRTPSISTSEIRKRFTRQLGFDIETRGTDVLTRDPIQLGLLTPSGSLHEINLLQKEGFEPTDLQRFHHREKGLVSWYSGGYEGVPAIDLTKEQFFEKSKYGNRKLSRAVMGQAEAARWLNRHLALPQTLIGHNIINFEFKKLDGMIKDKERLGFAKAYNQIQNLHKKERWTDIGELKKGLIDSNEVRARDRIRAMEMYEWMIKKSSKEKFVLDTMELAKALNAMGQERGLISGTSELALGTNVEFLSETLLRGAKETHIGTLDPTQQNPLAPRLVYAIEELKAGRDPRLLKDWKKAWKDPTKIKTEAVTKSIERALENFRDRGFEEVSSGTHKVKSFSQYKDWMLEKDQITQGFRVSSYDKSYKQIFESAMGDVGDDLKSLMRPKVADRAKSFIPKKMGMMTGAVAGVGLGAYLLNRMFEFSGNDEEYNTIEGLRHGWFGKSRKYLTDFGSGYKGPIANKEYQDPTPTAWGGVATVAGAMGGSRFMWNKSVSFFGKTMDINKLSYMGEFSKSTSDFLGREKATYGDVIYNAIRRAELAMGGIPKAFSISTIMSPSILRDVEFDVDLKKLKFDPDRGAISRIGDPNFGYKNHLLKLSGRSREEFNQFEKAIYRKGKLFGVEKGGARTLLMNEARLMQAVHAPGITDSTAQLAKSYQQMLGIKGVGKEHEFLITGGRTKTQAGMRTMHAFAHETVSKYLRLMDDPVKAFRDVFPNINPGLTRGLERVTKFFPQFGTRGNYMGTVPQLMKRHAMVALPLLIGIPALYGTVDWMARQIGTEGSILGEAGITGVLAEGVRAAHMTYAGVSDALGLTSLRKSVEEQAPGMTGVKPFLGLALTGTIAGTALGMARGVGQEIAAPAGKARYEAMVKAKSLEAALPKGIRRFPGMKGAYSQAVRGGKYGALIAGALALPFFLTGLGSNKSTEELNEEYIEGKEVAVKKARWWEFGMTPWEGERTMYYRPDWYNRLMARPTEKSIYDGEDISPIGKFVRTLADPYWLEKKHYEDRPYPIAGSSGEGLGIFGPLYEWTLGRVLKPPAYMHTEEWAGKGVGSTRSGAEPSIDLGGLGPEKAITPYSLDEQIKQQYYTMYEAMGLRGFTTSAVKQAITGEQDIGEFTPILQSSADIDSARRKYWDLNLGGLLGMTEPVRRLIPKRPYTTEYINPIENKMPDWMPGKGYFIDFKSGDPFVKVSEGEYRLPGRGYEARYKELEGLSPEKYPLIHKYKILADVAPYSPEYRRAKEQLSGHELTEYEQDIFNITEKQVEEKRIKKRFRDEVYEQSIIGRYGAAITDIARASPFEELLPLSPAHKLMPRGTALQAYEQSVYGKEFKLWQRPIDDFIKPFATTVGNLIGIDRVPTAIADQRKIEEYFDQLTYTKNRRLEKQAVAEGATAKAKEYREAAETTLIGADVYGNEFRLRAALPKRERIYFDEFKDADPEEREKILELIPENMKELYIAQWDKELLSQLQEGKLEVSDDERYNLEKEIFGRMTAIRSKRAAAAESLENSTKLPDDEWIGWRADVDMDDVKLKYLIQTGRDFHNYDLWDDRLRSLRRKPYLEEATEGLDPFRQVIPPISFADVYREAAESGIKNPSITLARGIAPSIAFDLEYEREDEMKEHLRELGYVI